MSAPVTAAGQTDAADVQTAAGNADNADSQSATGSIVNLEQWSADQKDMPGKVDSQRGRAVYSGAENQNAHVRNLLDGDRYFLQHQLDLAAEQLRIREENRAEERRQREELFDARLRHTDDLHVVLVQGLSAAQSSNQVSLADLINAFGQIAAKMAGDTPPVTVASPKAS